MKNGIFAAILAVLVANPPAWGQETAELVMPNDFNAWLYHTWGTQPRMWGIAEYLLWWSKPNSLSSPLQSTTSNPNAVDANGNNVAAGIGRDGTSIITGGDDIRFGALSGMRLTLGLWFDEGCCGIEGRGFFLGLGHFSRTASSDANGNPVVAIPIIDTAGLFGGGENAIAESFPGVFRGSTTVTSTSSLWGAEVNAVMNCYRRACFSADLLVGFRFAELVDELNLYAQSSNITSVAGGGVGVAFLGGAFDGTVTSLDTWRARNQFYGGQIGVKTETQFGRAFLNVNGRLALGGTHQYLEVRGNSGLESAVVNAQTAGGTLALASNSGRFTRNEFSAIPEVEINVGYNFCEYLRGFVGYNFMYWSNVVRSGEQIDRNVDVRQVPTLPTFNGNVIGSSPAPQFNNSAFWAQGINFGLQYTY